MWIDILSIIFMVIVAIWIGRERDKHTRNGPGMIQLKVEQIDEERTN